ncbi:hypothetical protein B0H14DRAFT_2638238 [Mycena olivaceomarginata]|nr:hypothetical protein B0H14DRAFT_2638238 [Mycena olivaceomarginata]
MPYNVASFSAQDFENCRQYAKALIAFTVIGKVYLIKVPGAPLPEHFNNIINQRRAESAERLAQDNTGLMQAMRSMMDMHGDLVRQVLASRLEREIHELNQPRDGICAPAAQAGIPHWIAEPSQPPYAPRSITPTPAVRWSTASNIAAMPERVPEFKARAAVAFVGTVGIGSSVVTTRWTQDCSEASSSGLTTIVEELELSKESDVLVDVKESDDLINLMETDNEWEDNGMNADMTNFGN